LRIRCTVFEQKKEDHYYQKQWSSLLAVAGAGLGEVKKTPYPLSVYNQHDNLLDFEIQMSVVAVLSIC